MSSVSSSSFKVHKKVLANGLTILTKPVHHVPRIETHLWYNVGSKDEEHHERGMAHLIEHMLFKGTKNLSESDINVISQKLTADANAFTSQDYTCYTFRFPSHVWQVALELLAECMQNATFNPQMLSSELKTVIEEIRLYRENYQGALFEQVIAGLFPEHPYRNPIIGTAHDLASLSRDALYAFYKRHYHPANAVLVVVGDVNPDDVFKTAEQYFGPIPSPTNYTKRRLCFQDDLVARTTMLYRLTSNPWFCYTYKVPGLQKQQNHLVDIASLILSVGKSSRLYQRLVNKEKVASDIDCSVYDLFEKGLLTLGIWPANNTNPGIIEEILIEEFEHLAKKQVLTWEFDAAKKRTQVDFSSLLESTEKQAFVIGNSYLATHNESFIENYLDAIAQTTKKQLQEFFGEHFSPTVLHKGYLLPASAQDLKKLISLHLETESFENNLLQQHQRTEPVQQPQWALRINQPPLSNFSFPKPQTFTLPNGLEVIYHNNPTVPQIISVLTFKANYLYEPEKHLGLFGFLLRTITDRTQEHDSDEFAKLLESQGIYLGAGTDNIAFRCMNNDFEKSLKVLATIIKKPSFDKHSIQKAQHQILSELDELWDSPIDFLDQIAKEYIYQKHPYHKNPLGTKESIKLIKKKDLENAYKQFISPYQANLIVVGDLTDIDLQALTTKYFSSWEGPTVQDLTYPPLQPYTPGQMSLALDRDQVVLGFVAPSISRKSPEYNALALLDTIVTGGVQTTPSSRLFQLREKSGLFYTIGGSLVYGSREEPGMAFIKTIVTNDKAEQAKQLILETIDDVGHFGISQEELDLAKNSLFAASVELFESNAQIAQTFLFLKKLGLSFNLFDKQGELLSIISISDVNEIAKRLCKKDFISVIQIGRKKE